MRGIAVFACVLPALAVAAAASQEVVEISIAGRSATLEPARMVERLTDCHAVVAFREIPTEEQRGDLADLGVRLYQYLTDFTYFATVPGGSGADLLA